MHSLLKQLLILGLLLGLFYVFFWNKPAINRLSNEDCRKVQIAQKTYILQRAINEEERNRGLSGTPYLEENTGMIFEFEQPGFYGFWMKEMLIPIDIIFVQDDIVTDIYRSVSPESFPESFLPSQEINFVIELASGESEKSNINVGEEIFIEAPESC